MFSVDLSLWRRWLETGNAALVLSEFSELPEVAHQPSIVALVAQAYAEIGNREQAWACAEQLDQNSLQISDFTVDTRVDLAGVWLLIGQHELALDWVQSALTEQPDHALALARLGACYWQQQRLDQALVCYQDSMHQEPQRLSACLAVIQLALALSQSELAQTTLAHSVEQLQHQHAGLADHTVQHITGQLRAFQLQVWLQQGQDVQADAWLRERQMDIPAQPWLVLASGYAKALSQQDRLVEAEEQLRLALRVYPKAVMLILQLAELLCRQGYMAQARLQLNRATALLADSDDSQQPNAQHRNIREQRQTLKQTLDGLEIEPSPEYRAAEYWHTQGQFDRAWTETRQASDKAKRASNYDPVGYRQQCARIRHAFSPSLYQHRSGIRNQDLSDLPTPVFVVGLPHSGADWLEQTVGQLPQIGSVGASSVLSQRIQGLNRWERYLGTGRSYPDCVDDLTARDIQGLARGILNELQELAQTQKSNARYILETSLDNIQHIGLIRFLFPNARIIALQREPRDLAVANYLSSSSLTPQASSDLNWLGQQLADHHHLMRHWQRVFPEDILQLQYEQCLSSPLQQVHRVLIYLGVEELSSDVEIRALKTVGLDAMDIWQHYRSHLAPLIQGTNAAVEQQPIQMISLPLPGLFADGQACYRKGNLDEAELNFKKMLHHNPDHISCQFMVGLIYCRKGHADTGLAMMERAVAQAPWRKDWRQTLNEFQPLAKAVPQP